LKVVTAFLHWSRRQLESDERLTIKSAAQDSFTRVKGKMEQRPQLIALVGGSGSGKTWLARRLQRTLGSMVSRLSLDDFYQDRSSLPQPLRARVNLDHPRAIDWRALATTLRQCHSGKPVVVSRFSVATRTRLSETRPFTPRSAVIMDGTWLLLRREIRNLFDFRVYLDCPMQLRLERRLARDVSPENRARNGDAVRRHFWRVISPLHERYVAPQAACADIVMRQPPSEAEVENLAETIRALVEPEPPISYAYAQYGRPAYYNRL
jgi:uridine kinase